MGTCPSEDISRGLYFPFKIPFPVNDPVFPWNEGFGSYDALREKCLFTPRGKIYIKRFSSNDVWGVQVGGRASVCFHPLMVVVIAVLLAALLCLEGERVLAAVSMIMSTKPSCFHIGFRRSIHQAAV